MSKTSKEQSKTPKETYKGTPTPFQRLMMSHLRRLWTRWPARIAVLKKAKVNVEIGRYKNGNVKNLNHYKCSHCKKVVRECDVDHIEPAIPIHGFESLDNWCERLFVGETKLQVLCESCHAVKTNLENEQRRAVDGYVPPPRRQRKKPKAKPSRSPRVAKK